MSRSKFPKSLGVNVAAPLSFLGAHSSNRQELLAAPVAPGCVTCEPVLAQDSALPGKMASMSSLGTQMQMTHRPLVLDADSHLVRGHSLS